LLPLKRAVRSLPYLGTGRFCPVCQRHSRAFRSRGNPRRDDAQCVHCLSLERHRLFWLFLRQRTDFFDQPPQRMLHVASEVCLVSRLRSVVGDGYLQSSFQRAQAEVTLNVTEIDFTDGYFDVVYCSHVLTQVEDDRQALRELHRVLKPGGWAVIVVPITTELTIERSSFERAEDRLRVLGQGTHRRLYGHDYKDRLREAGFSVSITTPYDLLPQRRVIEMGLTRASGDIFFCTREG